MALARRVRENARVNRRAPEPRLWLRRDLLAEPPEWLHVGDVRQREGGLHARHHQPGNKERRRIAPWRHLARQRQRLFRLLEPHFSRYDGGRAIIRDAED